MAFTTAIYLTVTLRPSYGELLSKASTAESDAATLRNALQASLDAQLAQLAAYCALNEPTDRVSMYGLIGDAVVVIGRFSSNNKFASKPRRRYPMDQGVIGRAWKRREACTKDLPSKREEWNVRVSRNFNIPIATVRRMRMQSRSIAAIRLQTENEHLGVIVFESTGPRKVTVAMIATVKTSFLLASLIQTAAAGRAHLPNEDKHQADAVARAA